MEKRFAPPISVLESGGDLHSRAVPSQVPSARGGLTSVFGMGTGGSLQPLPPEIVFSSSFAHLQNCTAKLTSLLDFPALSPLPLSSLDQALDLLVSASFYITAFTPLTYLPCRLQGVLPALAVAIFFSRWASRLDAFSVYPFRTSLPSYAVGTTTVSPEVRPSRSSRTRDSSCHDSCAHDG